MQLIQDAGFTGIAILVLFVAALGMKLSGKSKSVVPWAVALLAVGEVGQAVGMRVVTDALTGDKVNTDLLLVLAVGSTEASTNLLLGGAAALAVLVIGFIHDKTNAD